MRFRWSILSRFLVLLLAIVLGACANIGKPSGGEKDTAGPEIIGILPYPGTLFFDYKEVVFHFDEFLKPGNYKDEIFISPVPAEDPEIRVKNKTLTIRFMGPLRENTTYVISLGTGIADFNESNKMDKSYTYAFSTGAILDSMKFKGRVDDMWTGGGEAGMKIMLFPEAAVEGNDIAEKRPEYMVATGKDGEFEFNFLAPGRYKIYGVGDANNDSKYNGSSEKIALAADPLVVLSPEDSVPLVINMASFFQDTEGPKAKSAKWSNAHTIHVEFSEKIRARVGGDSLGISLTDTLGGNATPLTMHRFRDKDSQHLYLHAGVPRDKDYDLHIVNLMDSLGHKGDTTIRLSQLAQVREERGRWFAAPINQRRGHEFLLPAYFKLPEQVDSSIIQLVDTGGVYQPVSWRSEGMKLYCKPPQLLEPGLEYQIRIRKSFPQPDGKPLDTLLSIKVVFPNPDNFGTLSGKVLSDSTRPGNRFQAIIRGATGTGSIVQAKASDKEKGKGGAAESGPIRFEERFSAPGPFKYVYLHPGEYTIDIIDDQDGNGVLSPGSLVPYQLPEKVYHQVIPMEIKAKWDVEDMEIYPIPQPGKGKTGGKTGKEVDGKTPADKPK